MFEPERPLDPPEETPVECPICGRECSRIYRQGGYDGPVIACDMCLFSEDVEDYRLELIEAYYGETV